MAVTTNDRRLEHPGNSVNRVWQGPRVFDATHLEVYRVTGTTSTLLTLNVDYTITGLGLPQSTVTETVATPTGSTLLLLRRLPMTQETRFRNQGAFFASLHEDALDLAAMRDQQLQDGLNLALRLDERLVGVSGLITTLTPLSPIVVNASGTGFSMGSILGTGDMLLRGDLANTGTGLGAQLMSFKQPGTGGLARTVDAILRDMPILSSNFPVVIDGVTSDSAAVQQVINQAVSSKRDAFFRRGTYLITTAILNNGCRVRGEPGTKFKKSGQGQCFQTKGVIPAGNARLLSAPVAAGSRTATFSSVAGIAVDTTVILAQLGTNLAEWPEGPDAFSEYARVQSIVGNTITFYSPLTHSYTNAVRPLGAIGAELMTVTPSTGVAYEDIEIEMDPTALDPTGVNYNFAIDCMFASSPKFKGVTITNAPYAGICLTGCQDATIDDCTMRDFLSADDDVTGGFGYAVCEQGMNTRTLISNLHVARCRHAYTTAAGSPNAGRWRYGMPQNTIITDGVAVDMKAAAWDTHPAGMDITFDNCKAIGSRREALQVRCRGVRVYGFFGRDCQRHGIFVSHGNADGTHLHNVQLTHTNLDAAYYMNGAVHVHEADGLVVSDLRVDYCSGPAVYCRDTGVLDVTFRNISVYNPCQNAASDKAAIVLDQNLAANKCLIDGLFVRSTDGKTDHAVKKTGAFVFVPEIYRVVSQGIVSTEIESTNHKIAMGTGQNQFSLSRREAAGIVGDAITLVGRSGVQLELTPEAGAADNLANINGAVPDGVIYIRGTAGNTITVKHGTGNLRLVGAVDASLNSGTRLIALAYVSGAWFEMYRIGF